MNREQKAILIVGVVLTGVILVLLGGTYYMWRDMSLPATPSPVLTTTKPGTEALEEGTTPVYLYYYDTERDSLVRQSATLSMRWKPDRLPEFIAQSLERLQQPPAISSLVSAVPIGTHAETVFLDDTKRTVYLSLNEDYFRNHPGGTIEGWASLYSIVNTVCSLSPSIEQVWFLRQGRIVREGPGGWDYSQPYRVDEALVRVPESGV